MIGYHRWVAQHEVLGVSEIKTAIEYVICLKYADETNSIYNSTGFDPHIGYITKEITMRTYWSAAILDVYVSSIEQRPRSLRPSEVSVPLPCTDEEFNKGELQSLLSFGGDYLDRETPSVDLNISTEEYRLSYFIRAVHLYGECVITW